MTNSGLIKFGLMFNLGSLGHPGVPPWYTGVFQGPPGDLGDSWGNPRPPRAPQGVLGNPRGALVLSRRHQKTKLKKTKVARVKKLVRKKTNPKSQKLIVRKTNTQTNHNDGPHRKLSIDSTLQRQA